MCWIFIERKQKEFMKPGGLSESIIEEAVKRQYHLEK
jgi:hypothetical protein